MEMIVDVEGFNVIILLDCKMPNEGFVKTEDFYRCKDGVSRVIYVRVCSFTIYKAISLYGR